MFYAEAAYIGLFGFPGPKNCKKCFLSIPSSHKVQQMLKAV